jgi:hypothetical protein
MKAYLATAMYFIRTYFYFATIAAAAFISSDRFTHISWQDFCLLTIAGLPFWLPMVARYIKALRKTDGGYEIELQEDPIGLSGEEIRRSLPEQPNPAPAAPAFDQITIHARRILHALWHYQKETFKEDETRRWGFGVGRGAPDFPQFVQGVRELGWEKLVYWDRRGLVYLTDEGYKLCKAHEAALTKDPLHYTSFVSAPT